MPSSTTPLRFAQPKPKETRGPGWKVLIVDDEPAVHQLTENVLGDFTILGRPLYCYSAYNEQEARQLFVEHPDAAVCLLDVVMDAKDTGLRLVEHLRHDLGQSQMRVVLRTGQPGMAPEREVFEKYDINDYKTKTELTDTRLYLTLLSALRDYEALASLQRQKEFLADVMDSLPEIHLVLDPDLSIVQANAQAVEHLGDDRHQIEGKNLFEKFGWLEARRVQLVAAAQEAKVTRIERIKWSQEGKTRFYDLLVYPLSSTPGLALVLQDVTLKRRYEQMMIQSEKMLSVGGLAAGVAHEINNPLSTIHQAAQNVARRLSGDLAKNQEVAQTHHLNMNDLQAYLGERKVHSFLSHITEAAERASSIVQTMLRFSRRSEARRSSTDLNHLLESTLELALSDIDLRKRYQIEQIDFHKELAENLPLAPVEVTEVQQVFYNLIKNAAQALAETEGPRQVKLRTTQTDPDWIEVSLSDNGPGMNEETRSHILEPFYTTKEIGEGTGLGLAVSYFIVTNNHGGQFEVLSEPDQGTKVVLKFPLRESHAS